MSRTLVIKPSGLPEERNQPWSLCLRQHDLGGTDYERIALLTDDQAREVIDVSHGTITWLYGTPDWNERLKARMLEEARKLEERAQKIRTEYRP